MLALTQFESELCSCGNHISITEDPSNVFMPETRVCRVCAGMDQFTRIQQDRDSAAEKALPKDAPPRTPRPADGRRTFLRPIGADELAARKPV